jgi:phenylpropionate dioxygenase-like ring-hydroxylating dioxygenase large terminal subunit
MLSREDNQLIAQVGPGTPMGNLFRLFWLPGLIADRLREPDGPPVRLRILGEDLVAFRDSAGKVGFVQKHCPHRGASLFFGRNEEEGLRCVYHGWKFDASGACVDMPNEPPESNFRHKVRVTAYPSAEHGGLIWIYMGPPDRTPELPQLEWTQVSPEHRTLSMWMNRSNWLQILEGDFDTCHSMFLHSAMDPSLQQASRRLDIMKDKSPRIAAKQTEYGMVYGGRYQTIDGHYVWRLTQWLLPSSSIIASRQYPFNGRYFVPMDDHHTAVFSYLCHPTENIANGQHSVAARTGAHVDTDWTTFQFPDGTIIDTGVPIWDRRNDYGLDREVQRTRNYAGMLHGAQNQDLAMTETMGIVVDRTKERLGTTDTAIIALRRRIIQMARDLERGIVPTAPYDGSLYKVRSYDAISDEPDFERFLAQNSEALLV